MKVGICHQVSLPGTWEDAIDTAATLGVDGIELFVRPDDVPAFLESRDRARALAGRAERAGLTIRSLALIFLMRGDPRLGDTDEGGRVRALGQAVAALERAADVGARVVLVGGVPPADDAAAVDAYVRSLQEMASRAEALGLRLGIESGYTGEQVETLLGRIGRPAVVGDYFDLGGAAGRDMDPAAEIRRRGKAIVQIHVKGVRGAGLDAGTVDLAAVRAALAETGYDGWLLLETAGGEDPVGNARGNLRVLRDQLKVEG
jgi:sugar phosphate isomerase/epimerase